MAKRSGNDAVLKDGRMINFVGQRVPAMILSGVLLLVSVVSLAVQGLNFGIDFTGGTLVEVGYPQAVELGEVRTALQEAGYTEAVVQSFGTARDVLIRLGSQGAEADAEAAAAVSGGVMDALRAGPFGASVELRRVEFVGPQLGRELAEAGGLAMLLALIGLLIYIALRFEKKLSVGAILALAHDAVIVLGVFSLFQIEFDPSVLAAILAVIGYSTNDNIVIYDRLRENFRKMRKGTPEEIMNLSVNQTLARTIVTSLTTLLVLFALYFLGGEVIRGFSIALIVGVIVATFSSIYVATSLALALGVTKQALMPIPKEGSEVDPRP